MKIFVNTRYLASSIVALFATVSLSTVASAFALPLGHVNDGAAQFVAPNDQDGQGLAVDFTAIVALSNCSGSLVRFTTSLNTDKAMILTNGHCLEGGFVEPGDAIVNRASTRSFSLLSSDARATLGTLRAERVIYATMTGTDATLYRLNTTYADILARFGVTALTISDHKTDVNAPITIVSGYWKRIYSCNVSSFIYQLKEGDWMFTDSILYSEPGCDTIGGTSGSPIIHSDTKEVVGVNNTGNEDGERCTLNNPCEIDEDGNVVVTRGASYGQNIFQIYACLKNDNTLDLTLPGCTLTRPRAAN